MAWDLLEMLPINTSEPSPGRPFSLLKEGRDGAGKGLREY